MSISRLANSLASIGRPRIIVVGEAILDEYIWGEVARISPEAPIPVLRVSRREERVGGAGSVVANLIRLGAEVRFLSTVGDDPRGEVILSHLEKLGCDPSGVIPVTQRRSIVKVRHLGYVQHADRAVQQLLRVDEEDVTPVGKEVERRLLDLYRSELKGADAVLISDYRKGLLTPGFLRAIIDGASGKPVLVDPGRVDDYSIYRGAYLICPNRYETSRASGLPVENVEDAARAARKLIQLCGFNTVVVTLDRSGIFLQPASGEGKHHPTHSTVVADVAGAGDMVLSVLGLVIAGQGSIDDAIHLANVAAGIEIRRVGVVALSREEIMVELRYRGHSGAQKIKTLPELITWVRQWRTPGKKTVFTNGCFDFVHYGHHHLLNSARQMGDHLIVAVNSDASIRRLKGPDRPFVGQDERLVMLAGLEAVDCVVLFEEDTPIPLLEAIRPDILVKGSEYRDGVVVGRDVVESYGGRVEFVEQIPGISTSSILQMKDGKKGGKKGTEKERPGGEIRD